MLDEETLKRKIKYVRSRNIYDPVALKACGELIQQLVKTGRVEEIAPEVNPEWNTPMMMVYQNGKWRGVLDSRWVNECYKHKQFPEAYTMKDIFEGVAGSNNISQLDMSLGYYQMEVDPE